MKDYIKIFMGFAILLLAIPSLVFFKGEAQKANTFGESNFAFSPIDNVNLLNVSTNEISKIKIKDYLIGSVLAQMPADFEPEALKAQAIICHTYIINRRYSETSSPTKSLNGADLSDDYAVYQKFFTEEQAKSFYGDNYDTAYEKATKAVESAGNLICTYKNQPIVTAFHAISCGKTESSESAWGTAFPYLVTVDSKWDKEISGYKQEMTLTVQELSARLSSNLNLSFKDDFPTENSITIKDTTEIGTVQTVEIQTNDGTAKVTGNEFAVVLNLNSCNFTIEYSQKSDNSNSEGVEQGEYKITCYGFGHMVGMSQYGANSMAKDGSTAEEILKHYFSGITVSPCENT